jgi:hypothetical protein
MRWCVGDAVADRGDVSLLMSSERRRGIAVGAVVAIGRTGGGG